MTKKQTAKVRANWRQALAEGRVVRLDDMTLKAFKTAADAQAYVAQIAGAAIVKA